VTVPRRPRTEVAVVAFRGRPPPSRDRGGPPAGSRRGRRGASRQPGGDSINEQQQQQRLNADIKVPRVRLIGADGEQIGIVQLADALRAAREQDLDLVEVAPNADPPVCRVMDFGKHKYEQAQKEKDARRRQSQITIKEIKMRPKISDNDYGTKSGHVRRFLKDGSKVRATIMFRGREMTHTELGKKLLDRLAEDMEELATIEAYPKVDGRNMVMVLAPIKEKPKKDEPGPAPAAAEAATPEQPTAEAPTPEQATADAE
jgi:translation initiation factor IF-3